MMSMAACSPTAMPSTFDSESGIALSAAVRKASRSGEPAGRGTGK
jgi:hypothetical protein